MSEMKLSDKLKKVRITIDPVVIEQSIAFDDRIEKLETIIEEEDERHTVLSAYCQGMRNAIGGIE